MRKGILLVICFILNLNGVIASNSNRNDILLVNSLKNFEYESHIKFQDDLYKAADQFIKIHSEEFVDNETGFFRLWGEAFRYFESDTRKEARWKSRLEKHFRTTEYLNFIKNKQVQYSKLVNSQRQELLGKLHSNKKQLFIRSNNTETTTVSSGEIAKVVDTVNKLVLTEVIPEVLESLIIPLCLTLLGIILGIYFAPSTKGIVFILSLGVSIWLSFKYSKELEQQINESFEIKEKQHLIILPQLNKNTVDYYQELSTKINQ
jgi:predicted RND superfamily exporter protein